MSEKADDMKITDEVGAFQEAKNHAGEPIEVKIGNDVYLISVAKISGITSEDLAKLKSKQKARELVKRAQQRAINHLQEGWTEDKFKEQFTNAQLKISQFLSSRENGQTD